MSHTPPKYTPWCSPDCSPDNSSDDLQNTPESASQMLPLSQLTSQDFWPKCGPNLRPEPEARQWNIEKKYGHNVARPMSRKRPKFLASHSQIFKDSLHRKDSEPGRSGHFLANGLATKWPNFDWTFSQFPISDFQIWPQTRAAFWPRIVAATVPWERGLGPQSREPFWTAVGGRGRPSYGRARAGQNQSYLGNNVERVLEASQPF